jgi:transcriptional regulator with XRE-family HTH domain
MPTKLEDEQVILRREIALRLRRIRERLLYTLSAMAREMRCTPQRWFNYETGRRPFDLPTMVRFCQKFGVTTDYLIRDSYKSEMPVELIERLRSNVVPRPVHGKPKRLVGETPKQARRRRSAAKRPGDRGDNSNGDGPSDALAD